MSRWLLFLLWNRRHSFIKPCHCSAANCIDGITVNKNVQENYINRTIGIVTALNPVLGYEKTTELAKEALQSGKGILELIREKKLLTEQQIKDLMDPVKLTTPNGPTNVNQQYEKTANHDNN